MNTTTTATRTAPLSSLPAGFRGNIVLDGNCVSILVPVGATLAFYTEISGLHNTVRCSIPVCAVPQTAAAANHIWI